MANFGELGIDKSARILSNGRALDPKQMLTRIRVRNFKALKDVDLKLGTRNVFIGANKTGKSSILQVLKFLTQFVLTGDVSRVLSGHLGFQQHLWKGISDGAIRFEIWGNNAPLHREAQQVRNFHYAIELGLDALMNLAIREEFLEVWDGTESKVLIQAQLGQGEARRLNGDTLFKTPGSITKPFVSYEIPGWEADDLRRYVQDWQFFDLIPQLPKIVPAQATAQTFLDAGGEQLSSWLHTFQVNYPEAFKRIVQVAKEAFPEIQALSTPVTQAGTTFLSIEERGLKSPVTVFYASDGELKFFQLLSIMFSPLPAPLVAIEEPEAHLHPRLIELLVETANQVRIEAGDSAAQVFATTHSPYLVDRLDPEDVIVVEKIDGATRCVRAEDKTDLRKMLEEGELSFGRLWYSGALGGN